MCYYNIWQKQFVRIFWLTNWPSTRSCSFTAGHRTLKTESAESCLYVVTWELKAALKPSQVYIIRFSWSKKKCLTTNTSDTNPPLVLVGSPLGYSDYEWSGLNNQSNFVLMLRQHMFGKLCILVCPLSNWVVNAVSCGGGGDLKSFWVKLTVEEW